MRTKNGRVRYAVVRLGYISQIAVLPAFAHARSNSTLTALVSGDPKKLKTNPFPQIWHETQLFLRAIC